MLPAGFEPKVSKGERPQTHALDRAAIDKFTCHFASHSSTIFNLINRCHWSAVPADRFFLWLKSLGYPLNRTAGKLQSQPGRLRHLHPRRTESHQSQLFRVLSVRQAYPEVPSCEYAIDAQSWAGNKRWYTTRSTKGCLNDTSRRVPYGIGLHA